MKQTVIKTTQAQITPYRSRAEISAGLRFVAVFVVIAAIPAINAEFAGVLYQSMIDTYVGVSTWVALTLAMLYGWEKYFKVDFADIMHRHKRWQPLIAAALGGMPGCGGAIVITTQYARGAASFGSLVATLTATMGDAAFLLIAAKPDVAVLVILGGIVIGTVTGYIIDMLPHSKNLNQCCFKDLACRVSGTASDLKQGFWKPIDTAWLLLLFPGLMMTIIDATGADANAVLSFVYADFANQLAVFMATFSLAIFIAAPRESNPMTLIARNVSHGRRIVAETGFISAWVLLSFFLYDATMHYMQWDLQVLFGSVAPLLPLVGILIGWLPGCGPQIVVTTLYINGVIPFSALMGNAISNDGDALFPALSIAPKSALWATAYSTVPAIIVAYGIYFVYGA